MEPWNKSLSGFYSLLNYVIPKSLKFSNWQSKGVPRANPPSSEQQTGPPHRRAPIDSHQLLVAWPSQGPMSLRCPMKGAPWPLRTTVLAGLTERVQRFVEETCFFSDRSLFEEDVASVMMNQNLWSLSYFCRKSGKVCTYVPVDHIQTTCT